MKTRLFDRIRLIRAMEAVLPAAKKHSATAVWSAAITAIRKDEQRHALSFSVEDPTMCAYSRLANGARTKIRLSRYLLTKLDYQHGEYHGPALTEAQVEFMCYAVQSKVAGIKPESIRTGMDIQYAYRDQVGGYTCMSGISNSNTALYANNPDKVALVVFKDAVTGNLSRALLWTCDSGKRVLDRIYPNTGEHVDKIRGWATDQGYLNRVQNGAPHSERITELSDGSVQQITLKVAPRFPYLDTFCWGYDPDDNDDDNCETVVVTNDPANEKTTKIFQNTGGNADSWSGRKLAHSCTCCQMRDVPTENLIIEQGSRFCADCHKTVFTRCAVCSTVIRNGDAAVVVVGEKSLCLDCAKTHTWACACCDSKLWKDDTRFETANREIICEECAVTCKTCGASFMMIDASESGECPKCQGISDVEVTEEAKKERRIWIEFLRIIR